MHGVVAVADDTACILFGEREASKIGHEGAGAFWEDVWIVVVQDDGKQVTWQKVKADKVPRARGWFDVAAWNQGEIVLYGGLDDTNSRLEDLWVLHVNA